MSEGHKRTRDIEDTLAVVEAEEDVALLGKRAARYCLPPRTAADLKRWFGHTKFGCMKDPHVLHFEPDVGCLHGCVYCYVKGYMCLTRRVPSEAMYEHTPAEIEAATRLQVAKLFAKPETDGLLPELHMSISTDCLQPSRTVQEQSYLVMKSWLNSPGAPLLSVVSKGIPYSASFRDMLLALFAEHANQVSYQCTCASVDENLQKYLEPGAPPPESRVSFAQEIVNSGVRRVSFRLNALIPGINDTPALIEATLKRFAAVKIPGGRLHVAVSYAYMSPKILRIIGDRLGDDVAKQIDRHYSHERSALSGGNGKWHACAELRLRTHALARAIGDKLGLVITSCGCDNQDVEGLKADKCGICWRSENRSF
jgi:DNA repair photolyase